MDSYQVVSEHSILGAQKDRQKEMEFTRKGSRSRTRGNERRSRQNHAPCRKKVKRGIVSQKLHEIYLDQKWQMLQQSYVTEKPRKPNEGCIDPEAAELEKEDKETADCVSLPSPAFVPKQIGNSKEDCQFSENIVHVQITIPNVADTMQKASMHHRDVELTLAKKTCTIDEPERCRRDASEQIRSDLRECESLIIRIGKSVAYKLHARPPEPPPEPPDRGLSTAEVFELVPMNNRVHQNLIINFTQLNNETRVSKEESEMENLKVSFPTIIDHKCSFLLDCGEEREVRYCSNGSMQLTNISILEMHPLVHQWELGGLKNYRWDPGGNKRDMGMQTTSSMEYQGNQTQQYYQGYQHVLFTFQQITNVVDNYGAFSMTFRVLKCPIIWVVKFKDVVRWLKRRNEIENKQLLFRCGEILNGKQGIRAESKVTTGNQCAHVGIGRGMYSINLRLKNVLLHCQLVAKIRSHKPPLPHNTWKAWLGKSSNGFKHSKSSECVKLENEFDIHDIGSMLLEFVMGRTTKKINDVEAFKDLLQAGKGVNKEPWKSNISWEIGKTYLAQAPKALMEICVEHLMVRLEFSRTQLWEALLKAWDPGELYSASCIVGKSCFKLWDPGGRVLIVVLYLHLEDKVNV